MLKLIRCEMKLIFNLFCFIFILNFAYSQKLDSTKIPNGKKTANIKQINDVELKIISKFDLKEAKKEVDKKNEKNLGFYFGREVYEKFSIENSGTWDSLPNGDRIWRLRVKSDSALTFNFENLH